LGGSFVPGVVSVVSYVMRWRSLRPRGVVPPPSSAASQCPPLCLGGRLLLPLFFFFFCFCFFLSFPLLVFSPRTLFAASSLLLCGLLRVQEYYPCLPIVRVPLPSRSGRCGSPRPSFPSPIPARPRCSTRPATCFVARRPSRCPPRPVSPHPPSPLSPMARRGVRFILPSPHPLPVPPPSTPTRAPLIRAPPLWTRHRRRPAGAATPHPLDGPRVLAPIIWPFLPAPAVPPPVPGISHLPLPSSPQATLSTPCDNPPPRRSEEASVRASLGYGSVFASAVRFYPIILAGPTYAPSLPSFSPNTPSSSPPPDLSHPPLPPIPSALLSSPSLHPPPDFSPYVRGIAG